MTRIGKKIIAGLRELNGRLNRGEPIEATRVQLKNGKVSQRKVFLKRKAQP